VSTTSATTVTASFQVFSCTTVAANVCTDNYTIYSGTESLGEMTAASCLTECRANLLAAGASVGCWILAGASPPYDYCYCRGGTLSTTTGTTTGGSCGYN
jgi:hypothetical protein